MKQVQTTAAKWLRAASVTLVTLGVAAVVHAQNAIEAVTSLDHVVLNIAANSMLRTKQRTQVDLRMMMQKIGSVLIAVIDRCLIADQSHSRATYQGGLLVK